MYKESLMAPLTDAEIAACTDVVLNLFAKATAYMNSEEGAEPMAADYAERATYDCDDDYNEYTYEYYLTMLDHADHENIGGDGDGLINEDEYTVMERSLFEYRRSIYGGFFEFTEEELAA